ncbi:MAG: sigma-54-dependent Fis family transcriptional regulator [Acidobacteria bacterium]|nr:sigma-54-dependent Fis family transcriptional regulator [Acidobacteriota bacterium]
MNKQTELENNVRILVIDDDPTVLEITEFHLKSEGYEVVTTASSLEGARLAEEDAFDLVLTDLQMPELDGLELVKRLKESVPHLPVIMISGHGSEAKAREATEQGAFYFVDKPVDFSNLLLLIGRGLEFGRRAVKLKQIEDRWGNRAAYYDLVGSSKAMQDLYELIDSIAESDANVFISGETGTGKELIANAVHERSLRRKKPLVKVNCSALPKELIESELFGHTKGAFTGATGEKNGLIGQSNGGSLFLDEIGEMPLELQPKLLRVLQERVYYRVGSEKPHAADFRLIAATNRDPLQAVSEGGLREDLYYRINTILIRVPPLRERAEDIQRLAQHFLQMYAKRYGRPACGFSQQAYAALFGHTWPGNVRELQNVIERAVLLCKGEAIERENLPFDQTIAASSTLPVAPLPAPPGWSTPAVARAATATANGAGTAVAPAPAEMELLDLCRIIVSRAPLPEVHGEALDLFAQLEGPLVNAALERTRGNKQAAANLLGIYRPRLYSIIKKYKLLGENDEHHDEQA